MRSTYPSMVTCNPEQYSYYALLNQLDKTDSGVIVSNSSLRVHSAGGYRGIRANIGVSSSGTVTKVYWEVLMNTTSAGTAIGVSTLASSLSPGTHYCGGDLTSWGYISTGTSSSKVHNGTQSAFAVAVSAGDVTGFALDASAGTLSLYINGTSYGVMYSGLTATLYPHFSTYGGNAYDYTVNFGASSFAFTPPAGYAGLHH